MDYDPLTKGECKGMRHFASVAQPGYTTPCYDTVRDTLMPNTLAEMEDKLRDLLQKAGGDGLVVSADIWTSRRGHSFLGIVSNFVDVMFQERTVLLACEHITGSHTAERIYQKYESVLKNWNVQRRVIRVVTDSASNMVKAFNLLPDIDDEEEDDEASVSTTDQGEPEDDGPPDLSQLEVDEVRGNVKDMIEQYITVSNLHLRCPIHVLQLALKDAINDHDSISRLLAKVSRLVKSVRKSALNTEECDRLGVLPTSACATRWSSQVGMIVSVLKDPTWQSQLKYSSAHLTANEVRLLTQLVYVLTPLSDLTDKMQKELGNLGIILPAVAEIKSFLLNNTDLTINIRGLFSHARAMHSLVG